MGVDLLSMVVALALLWMPRSWMRAGTKLGPRRKPQRLAHSWTHAPQDGTVLTFGHEFTKFRNYLDWFRTAVGTALLVGTSSLPPILGSARALRWSEREVLGLRAAILAGGLLIQVVRWERHRFALAAPTFYLGGVLCGLPMPVAGLCAFAVAWALVPVVPHSQGFLTVLAVVYAAVGLFLVGLNPLVVLGAALCFLPVLLSLLCRRPLMVFSRRPGSR
jgi:hypothetical protein